MKVFYDYNQQIDKLKNSDELIIDDEESAKDYLRLEGYYNVINGYAHIFKTDKKFIKGVSFENIRKLYEFDKSLRSIVYKYTSSIECHIKALIAHEFSRVHGVDENEYLKASSFTSNESSQEQVNKLIEDCQKTIDEALNRNSNKYRAYIAHNKAAHGERIFCARLPRTRLSTKLRITQKLSIPKNKKGENRFGRTDFLALLICCKYMLPPIEFASFINELQICLDSLSKYQTPQMMGKIKSAMGLPANNWTRLPRMTIDD